MHCSCSEAPALTLWLPCVMVPEMLSELSIPHAAYCMATPISLFGTGQGSQNTRAHPLLPTFGCTLSRMHAQCEGCMHSFPPKTSHAFLSERELLTQLSCETIWPCRHFSTVKRLWRWHKHSRKSRGGEPLCIGKLYSIPGFHRGQCSPSRCPYAVWTR